MQLFPKKSKENPNIFGRNRADSVLKATHIIVGGTDTREGWGSHE